MEGAKGGEARVDGASLEFSKGVISGGVDHDSASVAATLTTAQLGASEGGVKSNELIQSHRWIGGRQAILPFIDGKNERRRGDRSGRRSFAR